MLSIVKTITEVFKHTFKPNETVQYPEEKPYLSPRYRGRIVLTRDRDGNERCVACNLCSAVCPAGCIADVNSDGLDDLLDRSRRAMQERTYL